DFSSVTWYGDEHEFTGLQRGAVKILWDDDRANGGGVGGDYILVAIGSDAKCLRDVFRVRGKENPKRKVMHRAWGTRIVSTTGRRNVYCLCHPADRDKYPV